jgi:hypothetical protein
VQLEGLGQLKKSSNLIGNGTRDLPACSIVPQPTTLPGAPITYRAGQNFTLMKLEVMTEEAFQNCYAISASSYRSHILEKGFESTYVDVPLEQ